MHSGNYSLTDDEMETHVLNIVEMVERVIKVPLEKKQQIDFDNLNKVNCIYLLVDCRFHSVQANITTCQV